MPETSMSANITHRHYKDRVQLPFSFDVDKMQQEFEELKTQDFEYYNVIPLCAPAHEVDLTVPFPPPADDYADGSWTEWLDTPALRKSPYLTEVVNIFRQNTRVTLVRLLRLAPQATVKENRDPTLGLEIEKSVIRLTIPIQNTSEVKFILNGVEVPLKDGECWYLRLTDLHTVINAGKTERINLTIDLAPNNWIRKIIAGAM